MGLFSARSPIRRLAGAVFAAALAVSLTACAGLGSSPKQQEEPRVLRVGLISGDSYYSDSIRTEYTDLFEFRNKHIDIEIVYAIDYGPMRYRIADESEQLDPIEEMKKLMQGDNPPDVVLLNYENIMELADQNLLASLEPYIEEDNFDIDGFAPAVINALRNAGNGTLYALAPQFSTMALIYNKNIFDEKSVPYPTDNMTWREIFDLAERVTSTDGERKTFGFSFQPYKYSDIQSALSLYTAALPLRMFDDEGERMLVDSEAWRNALQPIIDLYQRDVIPENRDWQEESNEPRSYSVVDHDAFLSGRVAMTLIHYSQLREVINTNQNADNIKDFEPIEWDVVTFPVHDEYPNYGGSVGMYPVMAINAKAANPKDAWELIKFINGEEWAQLKSRSNYQLLTRMDYNRPMNGLDYNIGAFTALEPPPPSQDDAVYRKLQNPWMLMDIGRMKLEKVVSGELPLDQALKEWQTEGDAYLKQLKENPDQAAEMMEMEIKRRVMEAAGEL